MAARACGYCNGFDTGFSFVHTKDCPGRVEQAYYDPTGHLIISDPTERKKIVIIATNDLVEEMLEKTASNFTSHRHRKDEYDGALRETIANYLELMSVAPGRAINSVPTEPEPKATRPGGVEVKTVGQLIDELSIINIRIWMLIDKVMAGTATPEESRSVQVNNAKRNEYVRVIDRILKQADVGGKIYDR